MAAIKWGKWFVPTDKYGSKPSDDSFPCVANGYIHFRVTEYSSIDMFGDLSISPSRFRVDQWVKDDDSKFGYRKRYSRTSWKTEAAARASIARFVP